MRRIGPGGLEIGYWLHAASTGRGLATAAVAALVGQAFALPDIERVEIVHDQANIASGAIPRRLGFTEIQRAPGRKVRSHPARSASRWSGGSPDRELPAFRAPRSTSTASQIGSGMSS
jgi:ribosomal-protein-serine acetyltransferase